ncbi:MAG: Holliday junction branch migration protein RuvA [Candidatus Pacebacteria bacterium]|nr:Holliday junction branch migration protein RuvA [Candidatus Paceibacterota bacterium]
MIGYLTGKIIYNDEKHIILDVNDVGYKIYVSMDTLSCLSTEKEISLWIHTVVREDTLDLYGFNTGQELSFFKLVIGVSGIGPKGALGVMDIAPVETLTSAIAAGDTSYLTKVSGVGKKIAEKIVLELRDKVDTTGTATEETGVIRHEDLDVLEALKSLGYREHEAREAVKNLSKNVAGTSQKITEALKLLSND